MLTTLRSAVGAYVRKLGEMADPDKLAAVFDEFAVKSNSNPAIQQLYHRMDAGDKEAAIELQQLVADDAWGGCKSKCVCVCIYVCIFSTYSVFTTHSFKLPSFASV